MKTVEGEHNVSGTLSVLSSARSALSPAQAVRVMGDPTEIRRSRRARGSAPAFNVSSLWYSVIAVILLTPCSDGCATNKLREHPVYPNHPLISLAKSKIERDCEPYDAHWCYNNGICREVLESAVYKKTCLCRENFVGRRCELIYNTYLTAFALQQRLETAALPILITLIILLTCILLCAFYIFRRDVRRYSIANPNPRLDVYACI